MGGGGLDVDVAEHVVADVAADVKLFDATVPDNYKNGVRCRTTCQRRGQRAHFLMSS
jgi:hypothetical protein